jgi:hypothetical protein
VLQVQPAVPAQRCEPLCRRGKHLQGYTCPLDSAPSPPLCPHGGWPVAHEHIRVCSFLVVVIDEATVAPSATKPGGLVQAWRRPADTTAPASIGTLAEPRAAKYLEV